MRVGVSQSAAFKLQASEKNWAQSQDYPIRPFGLGDTFLPFRGYPFMTSALTGNAGKSKGVCVILLFLKFAQCGQGVKNICGRH